MYGFCCDCTILFGRFSPWHSHPKSGYLESKLPTMASLENKHLSGGLAHISWSCFSVESKMIFHGNPEAVVALLHIRHTIRRHHWLLFQLLAWRWVLPWWNQGAWKSSSLFQGSLCQATLMRRVQKPFMGLYDFASECTVLVVNVRFWKPYIPMYGFCEAWTVMYQGYYIYYSYVWIDASKLKLLGLRLF